MLGPLTRTFYLILEEGFPQWHGQTDKQTHRLTWWIVERIGQGSQFGEKVKAVHFLRRGGGEVSGTCQQSLASQGFTIYSGLLLGQGDVLTMLSSAMIYHVQWPIDGQGKHG